MPEAGDVLFGKLALMLICTLFTFALVVYPAAKKKLNLKISKARAFGLFFYAWVLSDAVYAVLYKPIHTGFGALPEGLGGIFDPVAAILLSAIASQLVVSTFAKRRSSTGDGT
jgi:hypothetical protein